MTNNNGQVSDKKVVQPARYVLKLTLWFTGERTIAEEILGMYTSAQILDDLDQLAWNISDCDNERQDAEFGGPTSINSDITISPAGSIEVNIAATFSGRSLKLIEQLAEDYLDGFDDYILPTILEYKSRSGVEAFYDGRPTSSSYEILVQ